MHTPGVEREMMICHSSQPHLVPPMKLVFYDDLPSPGSPQRSSTLPSWIVEGKSLASRASNSASLNIRRKSTTRPTISAPMDFRRVEPPQIRLEPPFRPLELSIHTPGNRLSDLPEFENFQLPEDRLPSPPPRALSPTFESSSSSRHQRHQSAPFQFPRKPVGSGSRRSSLATLEQLVELQKPVADPLIPYFATRITNTSPTGSSCLHIRGKSEPLNAYKASSSRDQEGTDQAPVAVVCRRQHKPRPSISDLLDRPLPPTPEKEEVSISSPPSTPGPATPSSQAHQSLRSGRIAQWLQGQSSSSPPSSPTGQATASNQTFFLAHSRSRTLSGSTVGSFNMSMNGGGFGTVTSLSSAITAATTVRGSSDALAEKEIESAVPLPVHSAKYMGTTSTSHVDLEPAYPTIYESEQQYGYEYDHRSFRESAIGLAF